MNMQYMYNVVSKSSDSMQETCIHVQCCAHSDSSASSSSLPFKEVFFLMALTAVHIFSVNECLYSDAWRHSSYTAI